MGNLVDVSKLSADDAIKLLTSEGQQLYDKIKGRLSRHCDAELTAHWELGETLAKAIDASRGVNKTKYCERGSKLIVIMSRALGFRSETTLRNAVALHRAWPKKADYLKMCAMRGETGNRLLLTHMVHLARVSDDDRRTYFAAKALTEYYEPDDLLKLMQKHQPTQGRPVGAMPRVPKTVMGCVLAMETQAHRFVNLVDRAWTGKAFDLSTKVESLPAERLSDELVVAIDDATTKLKELQARVTRCRAVLKTAHTNVKQRLREILKQQKEEDDDNIVKLNDLRNAAARAKRAAEKKKKAAKKARQRKRVGVKR